MEYRLPSIRAPQSFYDVFTVAVMATVLAGVVLAVFHGTIVRVEMVVLLFVVSLWVAWAINRILAQQV